MKKYTKWFVNALCVLALVSATATFAADTATAKAPVQTEQPANSWTLTLGGSGATTTTGDSQSAFGFDVGVGRTLQLVLPAEIGVRQGLAYASNDGGNVVADTHLFVDWTLLTVKRVELFAGGNVGATYGNTPLEWSAAPEVGVRWRLKNDVDIVGRVDYSFDLNNRRAEDTLRYFLGFRVKL